MKNKRDILSAWASFAKASGMEAKDDPVLEICGMDDDGLLLVLACHARLCEFAMGTRLTLMDFLSDDLPAGGREGIAMIKALKEAGLTDMTSAMSARLASLEAGFLDKGTVALPGPCPEGTADPETADPMVMARLLFDAKKIDRTFFFVRLGTDTAMPDASEFGLCPDILPADGLPDGISLAQDGMVTVFSVDRKMLVVAKSGGFAMAACEEPAVLGLDTASDAERFRLYRPWNYRNGFNAVFDDPMGDRLHPFPGVPGPIRETDRLSRLWLLLCVGPFLAAFAKRAGTATLTFLGLSDNLPATPGLVPAVSLEKGFSETAGCPLFKDPGGRSSHELLRAAIAASEDEIRREFFSIRQPVLPAGDMAAHELAAWRSARSTLGEAVRRVLCRDLRDKTDQAAGLLGKRFPDSSSILEFAVSRPAGTTVFVEDRGMASVSNGVFRKTSPDDRRFPAHIGLYRDGDETRFRASPPVCAVTGKGGRMAVFVTVPAHRMEVLFGDELPDFLSAIPPVGEDGWRDDPVADRFFHPWAGMTVTLVTRLCVGEARKRFPDLMPDKG